jgi:hypothetical protein
LTLTNGIAVPLPAESRPDADDLKIARSFVLR